MNSNNYIEYIARYIKGEDKVTGKPRTPEEIAKKEKEILS